MKLNRFDLENGTELILQCLKYMTDERGEALAVLDKARDTIIFDKNIGKCPRCKMDMCMDWLGNTACSCAGYAGD